MAFPRREAQKAATKAKTLETAARMFAELGYDAVTMRDLAAEMDMSTGAIFSSYPDKATLYAAVFGHKPVNPELGRKMLLGLRAYFTAEDDPQKALQALADLSVDIEVDLCPHPSSSV